MNSSPNKPLLHTLQTIPKLGAFGIVHQNRLTMFQVFFINKLNPWNILRAIEKFPDPFQEKGNIHISSVNNTQTPEVFRPANMLPFHHVVFEILRATFPVESTSDFVNLPMDNTVESQIYQRNNWAFRQQPSTGPRPATKRWLTHKPSEVKWQRSENRRDKQNNCHTLTITNVALWILNFSGTGGAYRTMLYSLKEKPGELEYHDKT